MMFFLRIFACSLLVITSLANAGYVEKGHYLYPIMIDIRYKKYDEAMAKLEPYALEGDAQALFWYGYMKQQNFGRDRYGAYKWFEQAGELGNPYALFKLSGVDGTGDVCEVNGWECSEDNLDKAIIRWKELAKKEDAKAGFFYQIHDRSLLEKFYDKFSGKGVKYFLDAAKKGYVRPLASSMVGLQTTGKTYQEYWGEEMYQALLDNVNKDPQIAMYFVHNPYEGMTNAKRRDLYMDSLKKGYGGRRYDWAISDELISAEEAYIFNRAYHLGTGEEFDEEFYVVKFNVDKKTITELNKKSEEFFNSIEHVINFDEMDFMFMFRPDV
ncbi:hypothetical protein ACMXYN_09705 [Neptuniibacter sp. PT8_73]|uniref:hypothetical protein n=1 Tax=Neptuniibacter sp. PT8_73 TaxID=3398206 RepID=UPI0039F4DBAE